ncbi:basic proline-rich protein-like [Gopherus flavomarginatus]|uniref:basic proline-rich protein-like n=1 Tax=Gopherus flavomarginatus TaxID=286002 RepID=UPI0021CBB08C|nr:basic proline-rich protein-like [Gopherus flavomarginatus]
MHQGRTRPPSLPRGRLGPAPPLPGGALRAGLPLALPAPPLGPAPSWRGVPALGRPGSAGGEGEAAAPSPSPSPPLTVPGPVPRSVPLRRPRRPRTRHPFGRHPPRRDLPVGTPRRTTYFTAPRAEGPDLPRPQSPIGAPPDPAPNRIRSRSSQHPRQEAASPGTIFPPRKHQSYHLCVSRTGRHDVRGW